MLRSRPATATTALSGTMGTSDWTFIFPESQASESSREHKLPTLDDFDMQIAVFEVICHVLVQIQQRICIAPGMCSLYVCTCVCDKLRCLAFVLDALTVRVL